jgi:hypothetical protein
LIPGPAADEYDNLSCAHKRSSDVDGAIRVPFLQLPAMAACIYAKMTVSARRGCEAIARYRSTKT